MVNLEKIVECFTGLVGWNPTADECVTVDVDDFDSSSGLFFNDYPGVSLSLAQKILDKDSADLDEYLLKSYNAAVNTLILRYLKQHKAEIDTKSVLSHLPAGNKPKNLRTYEVKSSRFVYVTFKAHHTMPVSAIINSISFAGNTDGTFKMYLYSNTDLTAIDSFDVTAVAGKVKEQDIEPIHLDMNAGQEYQLGYYEDDLPGNAIETKLPCGSCPGTARRKYAPFIIISPKYVTAGDTYLNLDLPNVEKGIGVTTTFGIDFRLTVGCDLTSLFCDNAVLFAKALQLTYAIDFFWSVYNCKNLNADAILSKEDARLMAEKTELDLKSELKNLVIDFAGLDCACVGQRRGLPSAMRL